MLRSLYSGISGLRSHQTMLDVTGNNIANVNTTGFKASSTQFQDTLSQLTQGAGGPQPAAGGTNPAQVGLGVQVAAVSTNFTQGSAQATGRATDMMISGDGFFVTSLGGETLYTRAGAFDFDADGRLVSPDGALVQGWTAVDGEIVEGGPIGNITLPQEAVSDPVATSTATVEGNLPSDAAIGDAPIVQQVQTFTADGTAESLTLTFARAATTPAGGWTVSDGTNTATLTPDATNGGFNLADGTDIFTTSGGIDADLSTVTGHANLSTVSITGQNGRAAGTLESYSLSEDGTLIGSFSNGGKEAIGRIAMANFVNPGGLEKAGSSSYTATANSGAAELGVPGAEGLGTLVGGYLEMSNVDLSQEFTNLIVAQRGFQANARIITTSDEVLQELTNLKR